jgi:hypothetical protein
MIKLEGDVRSVRRRSGQVGQGVSSAVMCRWTSDAPLDSLEVAGSLQSGARGGAKFKA